MAAFIPSRRDEEVNRTALAKVTEDKEVSVTTSDLLDFTVPGAGVTEEGLRNGCSARRALPLWI